MEKSKGRPNAIIANIVIRHCRKCKDPIEVNDRRPAEYRKIQFCNSCRSEYRFSCFD